MLKKIKKRDAHLVTSSISFLDSPISCANARISSILFSAFFSGLLRLWMFPFLEPSRYPKLYQILANFDPMSVLPTPGGPYSTVLSITLSSFNSLRGKSVVRVFTEMRWETWEATASFTFECPMRLLSSSKEVINRWGCRMLCK